MIFNGVPAHPQWCSVCSFFLISVNFSLKRTIYFDSIHSQKSMFSVFNDWRFAWLQFHQMRWSFIFKYNVLDNLYGFFGAQRKYHIRFIFLLYFFLLIAFSGRAENVGQWISSSFLKSFARFAPSRIQDFSFNALRTNTLCDNSWFVNYKIVRVL